MKPIIYVYDTAAAGGVNFDPKGQITSYKKLDVTPAWNSKGSFLLSVNKNTSGAAYLAVNRIIIVDDGIRIFKGYIEGIDITQKDNKANELVVATGPELKDQFYRVTLPPAGHDTDSYSNAASETVAKALINKNAAAGAVLLRRIAGLVLAADLGRGSVIDFSTRHKELLSEVYSILAVDRLGLTVDYDPDAAMIAFDVAQGVNRTDSQSENSQVILSTAWKTATEVEYKKDISGFRNVAITAGQGEGKDRTIVAVGDTEEAGYARREMFVDARDIADDSELPNRGAQKLAEAGKSVGFKIRHNNNGAFQIDEDFKLGDFITGSMIDHTGTEIKADGQVIKATYSYDAATGFPDISLVLDFDPDDIERVISNKLSSYNSLLSSEAKSALPIDNLIPKTSQNRPGVYKIYRRDDDSGFSVQTHWDGVRWVLQGYNAGDLYHAPCRVDSADKLNGKPESSICRVVHGDVGSYGTGGWHTYYIGFGVTYASTPHVTVHQVSLQANENLAINAIGTTGLTFMAYEPGTGFYHQYHWMASGNLL